MRGDTLIEVLFAVTVFSLVAVGALSVMNQGTTLSSRSLETTLVRQAIDGQAETLRFLHDAYVASYQPNQTYDASQPATTPFQQWQAMLASVKQTGAQSASDFGSVGTACPTPPTGSFIFDTRNVRFISPSQDVLRSADTYARLDYDASSKLTAAEGLWIEAIRSKTNTTDPAQANVGYIDFHIRACWYGSGQATPQTLGTIVRLYDPR